MARARSETVSLRQTPDSVWRRMISSSSATCQPPISLRMRVSRIEKTLEMRVAATEQRCDHHDPPEIMADVQLLGNPEPPMHLHRLIGHAPRGMRDIGLGAADDPCACPRRFRQRPLGRPGQRPDLFPIEIQLDHAMLQRLIRADRSPELLADLE